MKPDMLLSKCEHKLNNIQTFLNFRTVEKEFGNFFPRKFHPQRMMRDSPEFLNPVFSAEVLTNLLEQKITPAEWTRLHADVSSQIWTI